MCFQFGETPIRQITPLTAKISLARVRVSAMYWPQKSPWPGWECLPCTDRKNLLGPGESVCNGLRIPILIIADNTCKQSDNKVAKREKNEGKKRGLKGEKRGKKGAKRDKKGGKKGVKMLVITILEGETLLQGHFCNDFAGLRKLF